MGRYYNGDIEGKFWFAIQSSSDAGFFGGEVNDPNYINYYFRMDDLDDIKKGIDKCNKALGKYKVELDKFFKNKHSYTNEMLVKALGRSESKVHELLRWYARLGLGKKILKCVAETGSCSFEAEL